MKSWRIKSKSIDIINVHADTPMEAATLLIEDFNRDSRIEEVNRIFNLDKRIECTDNNNNKFILNTSDVLANAGLYGYIKDVA